MNCYICLFYCVLNLGCDECNVISMYFLNGSVNGSACFVCCVSDSVCKTTRNILGCGLYFVVEYYRSVESGLRCFDLFVCVCRNLPLKSLGTGSQGLLSSCCFVV